MSASCSVPASSAAALICDTGALVDYLVESAPNHRRFRDAIDRARTRYVPGLVLAEVDYFLRDERGAMQPVHAGSRPRCLRLCVADRWAALTCDGSGPTLRGSAISGLVDSSVVALAESIGVRQLATRDVRHFAGRSAPRRPRVRAGGSSDKSGRMVTHPQRDADRANVRIAPGMSVHWRSAAMVNGPVSWLFSLSDQRRRNGESDRLRISRAGFTSFATCPTTSGAACSGLFTPTPTVMCRMSRSAPRANSANRGSVPV